VTRPPARNGYLQGDLTPPRGGLEIDYGAPQGATNFGRQCESFRDEMRWNYSHMRVHRLSFPVGKGEVMKKRCMLAILVLSVTAPQSVLAANCGQWVEQDGRYVRNPSPAGTPGTSDSKGPEQACPRQGYTLEDFNAPCLERDISYLAPKKGEVAPQNWTVG
jgi:hypothetical protein